MSEKIKCSVCEFESENENNFSLVGIFIHSKWTNETVRRLKKEFGYIDFPICWVCFFKAMGVKPKEDVKNPCSIGDKIIQQGLKNGLDKIIVGAVLNPCDALTRLCEEQEEQYSYIAKKKMEGELSLAELEVAKAKHQAKIENEKQVFIMCENHPDRRRMHIDGDHNYCCDCYMENGGIPTDWHVRCMEIYNKKKSTYKPTLIPGCPAEEIGKQDRMKRSLMYVQGKIKQAGKTNSIPSSLCSDLIRDIEVIINSIKEPQQ
jgi:hypothetical protein